MTAVQALSITHGTSDGDTLLQNTDVPGEMTANGVKIVGFTVAGLSLVGLSRIFPSGAVFVSLAVLLVVLLTHQDEVTALTNRFLDVLGESQ
jgi:hypothetical protein